MSQEEFSSITSKIKLGDNTPLKEIYQTHAGYCISKLISNFKCLKEDAEDIYTDSVLNFRDKLVDDKIQFLTDVRHYLYATCKNMYLVKIKKEQRVNKAVEFNFGGTSFTHPDGYVDAHYNEQIYKLLESALEGLPGKCHDLLKSFYFDKLSLEEISQRFDMANSNVAKVSKARCFKKLVDLVRTEQKKVEDVIER